VLLSDESEINLAKENSDKFIAILTDLSVRRRSAERNISELNERLASIEKKLYGGAISNPKAMEAAEEEKVFIIGQTSKVEDSLLEIMVKAEDIEISNIESVEELRTLEEARPEEIRKLKTEEERLISDINQIRSERDKLVPDIPEMIMSKYESIIRQKGGRAVAKVEGGMCQGCRITLPTLELQKAHISNDTVQCNNCGRILYVV
jgi:predicted  nucleic acid-binding Zn-ribbon protein